MLNYDAPGLSVQIMPLACTDKVSGQRFADSVFLDIGGEVRSGCGGSALAADSLNGTSWLFTEIAGETVELTGDLLRDDRYAIDFYADGFVGYGGCNRISAAYSRDHDTLTVIPPWRHTTGRCSDLVMRREQNLLQILSSPVRLDFPDLQTLVMSGEGGTIKLRRKR